MPEAGDVWTVPVGGALLYFLSVNPHPNPLPAGEGKTSTPVAGAEHLRESVNPLVLKGLCIAVLICRPASDLSESPAVPGFWA